MELHASDAAGIRLASQRVAAELRAELARQKRSGRELSVVLGISEHTMGRRLNGETPFNMVELAAACLWLGISLTDLIRRAEAAELAS
ncbi:MAG: hypothetical protein BGO45_04700 [Microbacterium sp. 71-36]|uniref:hypothetical protein n=1 Tax=unclassified Microbacterium TaxID=2609290 RepID=UPI00086A6DEB|nr:MULTISPECIES: hypothetical protein [unclassified Microbacterium]MBN9210525.1 hypothetical protein [Microbacterium sp.]ODT43200.1 MAG: hypothetical protein ABS60_00165 [Microbacterium sp. SCN 71-17]OJV75799.1 MAG: hypothetical protein BGO45_04700 [Microbacterium sp. 71-36]